MQLVFVLHNKMDEVLKYGITVYAEKRGRSFERKRNFGGKVPANSVFDSLGTLF